MANFFGDDIYLKNDTARRLYDYAKDLPIYDFHCHLSPREIYEDRAFFNLTELWLSGDHYKWRLMRAFGIDEKYITGDAGDEDKFYKFAEALPYFIGNPVYAWAHFELKTYFGINLPICPENAAKIWEESKKKMADGSFSARKLIEKSNVKCVITTDDTADDLRYHALLKNEGLAFEVLPCLRADRLIKIEAEDFADYIRVLAKSAVTDIDGFNSLISAIEKRIKFFVANGGVSADMSFTDFPRASGDMHKACLALKARLNGEKVSDEFAEEYRYCIIKVLAKKLKDKNIAMQLHVGVLRNCNTTLFERCGADAGGDSVGNPVDIGAARTLFDDIEMSGGLPKTTIYTLNPTAYYPIATLLGDFQGGATGKMQLGAAWWFADHKDGIKEQLKAVAATGGLGLFNGMLTDSRSFTSYARHDYFRRIFCSLIGEWVEHGEYPSDDEALKKLVYGVCFGNAQKYFGG